MMVLQLSHHVGAYRAHLQALMDAAGATQAAQGQRKSFATEHIARRAPPLNYAEGKRNSSVVVLSDT
jgi:hypothetical protein